jgi:hypothetical protein
MFSQKNIVITIGNYGTVVALHNGRSIENKIFLNELNSASKDELKSFFNKNKSVSVYVLLDTIDQSYKKKVYPAIRRGDLNRIIKRDMASDGDKESLKSFILLNTKKSGTSRWESLFVTSATSETINKWFEFILEMQNRFVAIYMLPVEAHSLFKKIKSDIKLKSRVQNKKNDLYCFVMQNKVSGIRQIVFSDQGIVFTRVVNYNFEQADFLEKYEQDIYSTFEYLKRLFPELLISELDIVNIFSTSVLESIKKINSTDLNFVNYTPFEAAQKAGYGKIMPENSQYCDMILSKVFSDGKKILKFTIPKIIALEKFFLTLRFSYYLNLFLAIGVCMVLVYSIFSQDKVGEAIEAAETQKFASIQELGRIKKAALEDMQGENEEDLDIKQVTDFGKMEEALGSIGINYIDFYTKMKFLKDFNVILTEYNYVIPEFNFRSPSSNPNYNTNLNGSILNKSGDIEDLFKEFDTLVVEVKKNLNKNTIRYDDLPRNIDFNQKYYSFPINFNIAKDVE